MNANLEISHPLQMMKKSVLKLSAAGNISHGELTINNFSMIKLKMKEPQQLEM